MDAFHGTTSPVFELRRPAAAKRKSRNYWNLILFLIAWTIIVSYVLLTWYQMSALASLEQQNHNLITDPPSVQPTVPLEPLRFITVVGMYHSGTTAMWDSIKSNEGVAAEKGINLKAYISGSGGYPPCGVPLLSDSSVDMNVTMGNSSGMDEPNTRLFGKYGTMWADWHGNHRIEDVLGMQPPHKHDAFYTWWKHTPPQHPVLTCLRPDTLHVVMVRHPKYWQMSTKRKLYDFEYDKHLKLWRLIRKNPRRMPPLEIRFRSLFNAWEYYMSGYLSWEAVSAGKNCYAQSDSQGRQNCLGGDNKIPSNKRNILIVRYEDYLKNPKQVLAQIFAFATRGVINAKTDEDKFVPHEEGKLQAMKEKLQNLAVQKFFSVKSSDFWEGAIELKKACVLLGYSCDESEGLFIDDDNNVNKLFPN